MKDEGHPIDISESESEMEWKFKRKKCSISKSSKKSKLLNGPSVELNKIQDSLECRILPSFSPVPRGLSLPPVSNRRSISRISRRGSVPIVKNLKTFYPIGPKPEEEKALKINVMEDPVLTTTNPTLGSFDEVKIPRPQAAMDFKRSSEDLEEGEFIDFKIRVKNDHRSMQAIFHALNHLSLQGDLGGCDPLEWIPLWTVEKEIPKVKAWSSTSISMGINLPARTNEIPNSSFSGSFNLKSIENVSKTSDNLNASLEKEETKVLPLTIETPMKKDAETQTHIGPFRSLLLQMLEECETQICDKICDKYDLNASSEMINKPILLETKNKPNSRTPPFEGFSDTELPFAQKKDKNVKKTNITKPEKSKKKHYVVVEQVENVTKLRTPYGVSISCPYCKKTFVKKDLLNLHIKKKHLSMKNCGEIFECDKCDYVSREKQLLVKHQKFHNPQKMFRCLLCPFESRYGSHVNRHYATVHEKLRRFQCKDCNYSTFASSTLRVHVLRVHSKAKGNFACSQCDFKAIMRSELTSHIKTVHERTKIYVCSSCDFETSFNHNLKSHVEAIHLKIKKFECSMCSSKFFRKTHLLRHISGMHGTKTNKKIRRKLKREEDEL